MCLEATELALALKRAGVRVRVASSPGEQFAGVRQRLQNAGLELSVCDQLEERWFSKKQLEFLVGVAREYDECGPIVFHGWGIRHALLIQRTKRILRKGAAVRSVVIPAYLHHGSRYEPLAYFLAARIFRWTTDAVIAQCSEMVRRLEWAGVPREEIRLVYPGRDIDAFRKRSDLPLPTGFEPSAMVSISGRPLPQSLPKVASLALYIKRKDHATLFRAVRYLRDQGRPVACICVGWGPERERLMSLAHELGIADWVALVGRLDQNFVPAFISHVDLVASTSRAETFGHTLVEPIILGVPVVTTRVGVAFELESIRCAKVVSPGDWQGLGQAIAWVLSHPTETKEMVEKGQTFVLANYDVDIVARRFAALYASLVDEDQK